MGHEGIRRTWLLLNEFYPVRFLDGKDLWLPYTRDLAESEPFIRFCEENSPLKPLLFTEKGWRAYAAELDKNVIEGTSLGEKCYVDLRPW
jgi:hypothetical protein